MLTDTDHSRVRCSPIDSGMLKRPGTRSNRLGPDPDPADHLKYRPEPVRVPGPRVSGPPWRPLVHSQRSHLPGNFRALHASFCWQALWRCWFHFPAGLGTCPHCQRYQKLVQWPWCYCAWLASKLAWPEPHRESMGYCQEEDERHQTQQCRWSEGHCQRNLGFHTTSAVPQTDHLHATPNWGSN